MSKHSAQSSNNFGKSPSFIDFWRIIARELGSSRLKINKNASSISKLLDRNSDHKEYLRQAIQQSYKGSRCNHLRDPINLECVLDILGEIAFQLQGARADDLMDIELLEEIAWLIGERFAPALPVEQIDQQRSPNRPQSAGKSKAQVVSLDKAKIRRANLRL